MRSPSGPYSRGFGGLCGPSPFVSPSLSGQTRTLGQSWLQACGWDCPSLQSQACPSRRGVIYEALAGLGSAHWHY